MTEPVLQTAGLENVLRRSPILFRAVGTVAVGCLRAFWQRLRAEWAAEPPPHVALLALDTTFQQAASLPMIPPEWYVNLGDQPQLQERLRQARQSARVARYMPRDVTRLAVGRGAGGWESASRFMLETDLPILTRRLDDILKPFRPANRASLAERANSHPFFRERGMALSLQDPIEVVYVVSLGGGGTAGALTYDVFLMRHLLRLKGIEAHFSLFGLLPAVADLTSPESRSRLNKLYARLQELADVNAGKPFLWDAGSLTIDEVGPIFESCYLLNETSPGKLEALQRLTGEVLFEQITPLGKSWGDRSADMLRDVYVEKGPFGQPKFLSLVGLARVQATAFPDVVSFAENRLALRAASSAGVDVSTLASRILRDSGLTLAVLETAPELTPRQTPEGLKDWSVFLANTERSLAAEAKQKARAAAQQLAALCANARARMVEELRSLSDGTGCGNALKAVRCLIRELQGLIEAAAGMQAQLTNRVHRPATDALEQRLLALVQTRQTAGHAEYLAQCIQLLETEVAHLKRQELCWSETARALHELAISSQQHATPAAPGQADHALLDGPALEGLLEQAAPACVQEVRALATRAAQSNGDPRELKQQVQALVARHAQPFRKLADIDEALAAAGPRGLVVLQNALAAAEAEVRLDPSWDRREHCRHFAFVTVPETHPLVELARRQGWTVCSIPAWDRDCITIVCVDFGVEPAALRLAWEARAAYLESSGEVAPFADQRYEPLTDLVVPSGLDRFACLALPLHLFLRTGVVVWDQHRGFLYDGLPIGKDRVRASTALLKKEGRDLRLPSYEQVCIRAEQALLEVGTGEVVVSVLQAIEQILTGHSAETTAAERQVLLLERSAARSLMAEHEERIRQHRAHDKHWGQAVWAGPDKGRDNRKGEQGNGKLQHADVISSDHPGRHDGFRGPAD